MEILRLFPLAEAEIEGAREVAGAEVKAAPFGDRLYAVPIRTLWET
jgi:hypothetical protein